MKPSMQENTDTFIELEKRKLRPSQAPPTSELSEPLLLEMDMSLSMDFPSNNLSPPEKKAYKMKDGFITPYTLDNTERDNLKKSFRKARFVIF